MASEKVNVSSPLSEHHDGLDSASPTSVHDHVKPSTRLVTRDSVSWSMSPKAAWDTAEPPAREPTTSPASATSLATKEMHKHHAPLSSRDLHRSTQRHGVSELENGPHTEYVNMLLALDKIPSLYNLLAAFFTWILLAGFVLFPGTFASFQTRNLPPTQARLLNYVQEVPLYVIAWTCTGIGALGMIWLWWRWHKNYVWVVNRIFIPGVLNSLAGILSTLANIYGLQGGIYSETSKSTIIITGSLAVVCTVLILIYYVWLLGRLKRLHDREVGEQDAGHHGEGINRRISQARSERKVSETV